MRLHRALKIRRRKRKRHNFPFRIDPFVIVIAQLRRCHAVTYKNHRRFNLRHRAPRYGIMLEVARQSNDQYKLGPGTLYDNLKKLMMQGLVEEVQKRERAAGGDSRRRYYRLTAMGRRVLAAEVARLETVVRDAKGYLWGAKPRRA